MTDLFRYTLLADGTSDAVLIPIVNWLLRQHLPGVRIVPAFARDFGKVGNDLNSRVEAALRHFPCDLLFIHRDAEAMSRDQRLSEIDLVMRNIDDPYVPIIPIRMSEAWLLADEDAIRFAAGNASGRIQLHLPGRQRWESLADPKKTLISALGLASGKAGRALDKFKPEKARHLITPRSTSFAALRGLSAFDAFEAGLIIQLERIRNALD
ncbi:MAG: hypothetical protein QFF03_18575 [Pseudomonadota bacterium]|nr:hypothetical protein [Pseudomonadota bacterium]